jgi:hypothetical protein
VPFFRSFSAGDYNRDRRIDAADSVVWRKTAGMIVGAGSGADGNGDGVVNQADWQVWRANFGRMAAEEQGARSEERNAGNMGPDANQAPQQAPAWQPPVNDPLWRTSPGVWVAASRSAFRPPTQRFDPADDVLASLAAPRQTNGGGHDLAPAHWHPMHDAITDLSDPSIHAIDQVFETLGAKVAQPLS